MAAGVDDILGRDSLPPSVAVGLHHLGREMSHLRLNDPVGQTPFSASVVIAVSRPSWRRMPVRPAALRTERQAVRHDI